MPAIRAAFIPLTVPASEIRQYMSPGIQEVYRVLAEQGIEPAGLWFTHHLRSPGEGWGDMPHWIGDQGLTTRNDLWEVYQVGPDTAADSSAYRTQLNKPLA